MVKTKILIVEDDAGVRQLIEVHLERAGFAVVAAADGDEAVAAAERRRPAVALVDVNLPGMNGYAVCRELRSRFGDGLGIIFVSGTRTEAYDRVGGLMIGADDYVTKPFDPDELIARVRRLASRVPAASNGGAIEHTSELTRRELEILDLLVAGKNQVTIAAELFISPKTVATHIQRILGKLGVRSRTQAVALVARERALGDAAAG